MAQYFAFTSQNPQASGYHVVLAGQDGQTRADVRNAALDAICGELKDLPKPIAIGTELQNLIVLSASEARRKVTFRRAIERWEDDPD